LSVLSRQSIIRRVERGDLVIRPFSLGGRAFGLSFGLSSAGYDIRLARGVWLFPFWGRLAHAYEFIGIPNDLRMKIENKSTNARMFIDASRSTNGEPGWSGHLTLELTHDRPWAKFLPAGYPIAQVVFEEVDEPTDQPYRGKYDQQPNRPVRAILETDR